MTLATSTTEDVRDNVRQAAQAVEEQLRAGSEKIYRSALDQAERTAVERRDYLSGYAHDVSDALESASGVLETRGRDAAAQVTRRAAEAVLSLGDRVSGQDVSTLMGDIEDFARRRPALFLGGAFLAGFGLIRVLR